MENRLLPAGPTVVDICANAAFYYGLVRTLVAEERPLWSQMSFSAAEENFHAGARDGIDARVYWPGVGEVPVAELVLRRLLPAAHEGLEDAGVAAADRERLLGIIERRCVTMQNGAAWQAASLPPPLRGPEAGPRRGAAADDRALPRAHARERAGARVAAAVVPFTLRNLKEDLEDVGLQTSTARRTWSSASQARCSSVEQSGLSYQRVPPSYRFPYGHTHKKQEAVYVVLRGKRADRELDDEIVELQGNGTRCASRPVRGEATRPGQRASRSSSSARPNLGEDPRRRRRWPARLVG